MPLIGTDFFGDFLGFKNVAPFVLISAEHRRLMRQNSEPIARIFRVMSWVLVNVTLVNVALVRI